MIIQGTYTSAKVFAESIEAAAQDFIQSLCDHPAMAGIPIAQMPDVHAGKGCNVGTAYPIGAYLSPEHVGGDIGCAISMHRLSGRIPREQFELLDHRIRMAIPTGVELQRKKVVDDRALHRHLNREYSKARSACPDLVPEVGRIDERWLEGWLRRLKMQEGAFYKGLATLGGGNHFIEYGEEEGAGTPWLSIHTGSRLLGGKVFAHWQGIARSPRSGLYEGYLEGDALRGYLSDMVLAQAYARYNHIAIAERIEEITARLCKARIEETLHSPHNYIDLERDTPMLHKGSVDASRGAMVCIPFNMRDGIAIGEGLGNEAWNCSGPHGAGRRLSRTAARREVALDEFERTMMGVYSTSVCAANVDEAPQAYKEMTEILEQVAPSVAVRSVVRPRLNIKDIPR